MADVGRRIAELRAERGWTQQQLCERIDVSPQYLRRVEAGRANLSLRSLAKFARALQVAETELLAPPRTR